MPEKVVISWSGGKDSALTLYELQGSGEHLIHSLLVSMTEEYDRISTHDVRRALLEQQVESLGYPAHQLLIPKGVSNDVYEQRTKEALTRYRGLGVSLVAFGDIFLEDVRRYREERILSQVGMKGVFPLWKRDTTDLARSFIALGFKAITTCVDSRALGKEFVGRDFDEGFLEELPSHVDPCGENGEFHSFVYDGPMFKRPVPFVPGEITLREERFYYCDLMPLI